ncbi:MAG TPA: serine/threonine-protein kinase [Bryobacteraceae bacterium]|jgi:serine/threonine-protein kinase
MVGQTILHYQILERLGAGGMGEIYKAQDTRLNRTVAIKVLLGANSGDPESRRRFIQEAQAASSLNHPNIVTIHDIITQGSDQFMVMEFVNGKTLADLIPAGGLDSSTVLQYAVQIADGLHAAHSAGIVHRDLKPGNVMVTPQGLIKILDFGLAKFSAPEAEVSLSDMTQSVGPAPLTVQGSIIGTVCYMSPEQAQGAKVDARSDIFSFGCVLYEMVTGRKAFSGDSTLMILTMILRDEPKPIGQLVSGVPPELVQIIHRALRKAPGDRWQSMHDVHVALLGLKQRIDSGILTVRTRLPLPAPAPSKPWAGIAAIAVALLAVLFIVFTWLSHGGKTPLTRIMPTAVNPNAPAKPSALSPAVLNNDAILEMTKANVPAAIIIGQIRSSQTHFVLTTPEIIRLSKGGVTESVIQAMRDPTGAQSKAADQSKTVQVIGGTQFEITLVDGVEADCQPGDRLRFQVARDVLAGDAVVVAKGAQVTGVIVDAAKRKFLVHTTRPTFRLAGVTAVDGSVLKVRATRSGDNRKNPTFEPVGGSRSKDAVVPAGSTFMAYFDGDQTVTIKPPPQPQP